MRTLVVAIHGILTNQTTASWPDKLDAWMADHAPEIHVLKKEYRAGPFPKWNCWIKDPALAKSLANEIELFFSPEPSEAPQVFFVAHSNGAVIALLVAKILIQRGHKISGLILTGAACEADIEKNNILTWLTSPQSADSGYPPSTINYPLVPALGTAIAYSSPDDEVLPGQPATNLIRRVYTILARPYGSLGRTGWLLNGTPLDAHTPNAPQFPCGRVFTRFYQGGHSTYFTPENIENTFEQILSDIRTIAAFRLQTSPGTSPDNNATSASNIPPKLLAA